MTGVLTEFAFAPLRIATAATTSWSRYVAGLNRPASPVEVLADLQTWWSARTEREEPTWAHPSTVLRQWPLARLRDYSTERTAASPEVPTLVLPPQAGHSSCIVDYARDQSQLLTIRDAGLDQLYSLDWIGATEETADAVVEDYVDLLAETVELLGGRVNLVGDCQGGWLAAIYAALHPEQINTLTVAGAPIDFHAGASPLRTWTQLNSALGQLAGAGELAAYQTVVALGGGVQRGANQVLGFKMLEPTAELRRDLALWGDIRDPEQVARYRAFTDWFEWTQDVPGAFYLWIVEHLFLGNELITGELEVGGRRVDLGRIGCPLFLIAGAEDRITPPPQVWPLAEHASTPPDLVHRELVPGGHLGLFMSRESLSEHWTPLMSRVRELS
ncbi:alpha/beta fold hydrolase [Pseudonocardia spinosispora]|uniref:alpha/beta fold hydrolase n=1 Tax=Pseudonocardia spinosispora TaxID=103441 RepID=UPI00041A328F|nr:alpha/beta fold hydrolase [Pseudonocardia spinosispora]